MDDFNDIDADEMPTAPFWMTTFSDMTTLLLTFFVLIVSMSEIEVKKFQEALSHFNGHKNLLEFESVVPAKRTHKETESDLENRAERYEELLQYLSQHQLEDKVQVNLTERGMHVSIMDSVMFASGQAQLLPAARPILRLLGEVLGTSAGSVVVEGHTDNRPIRTSIFPSNWELSAARAAAVVRFFLQQENALDPAHYQAVGYGEYHPITSNETAKGRARNRRVEILFTESYGTRN